MKVLLRALLILIGLVVALAIVLVALVFTLNPNRLKPILEKQAAERGIELQMAGDIDWQLFPSLGLTLGALDLRSLQDKTLLAAVQKAEVSVQLLPLLRRQILVDGVSLDGLEVHYTVDAQGKSAWQSIGGDAAPAPSPAEPATEGSTPELSVESIALSNLTLLYSDAQSGNRAEIRNLDLKAQHVALDGTAFPIQLELSAKWNEFAPLQLSWQGPVSVNLDTQILKVADADMDLRAGEAKLRLKLTTDTHWGEPLTSKGKLELEPTALPPLFQALGMEPMQTANPNALQQVGASLTYDFGPDQLQLEPVALTVDKTRLNGHLRLKNFERPVVVTAWQGSTMALDDYLPPETPAQAGARQQAPEAPPQPLPLETLRTLDLDAELTFDRLTYQGLPMDKPRIKVVAKNGLVKLDPLSLQVADGAIAGTGELDARGREAQLQMALQSQDIDLGLLLRTFAELDKITGKATATATITSRGATDKALKDNLVMDATAESQELRVVPINIEEQFCRALSILQQQSLPQNLEWPDMTRLEPVQMQLHYAADTLQVKQLSAEIANLIGSATGTFNLATGQFNFPFSLSLGEFAGKEEGCLPIDEKWRKRALPIRCKGSLDDIGVGTCLPDTQLLKDLALDRLKGETREKLEAERDRLEEKLGTKARELLQEKYGEEKGKNTEEAVRDLFNQFKGKKSNRASEPTAAPAEAAPAPSEVTPPPAQTAPVPTQAEPPAAESQTTPTDNTAPAPEDNKTP